MLLFSKANTATFLDTLMQNFVSKIMKIKNFRGDLTENSAEKQQWHKAPWYKFLKLNELFLGHFDPHKKTAFVSETQ